MEGSAFQENVGKTGFDFSGSKHGKHLFMELSHGRFPVRRRQAGSQRFSVPFWSADRRIGPRLADKKKCLGTWFDQQDDAPQGDKKP